MLINLLLLLLLLLYGEKRFLLEFKKYERFLNKNYSHELLCLGERVKLKLPKIASNGPKNQT